MTSALSKLTGNFKILAKALVDDDNINVSGFDMRVMAMTQVLLMTLVLAVGIIMMMMTCVDSDDFDPCVVHDKDNDFGVDANDIFSHVGYGNNDNESGV